MWEDKRGIGRWSLGETARWPRDLAVWYRELPQETSWGHKLEMETEEVTNRSEYFKRTELRSKGPWLSGNGWEMEDRVLRYLSCFCTTRMLRAYTPFVSGVPIF